MKSFIGFVTVFYIFAATIYIMGGVFLLDNQMVKEPDDIMVAGDGESVYTRTWLVRNNGYEPTTGYLINIHIVLITFILLFFVFPKLEPNEDVQMMKEIMRAEGAKIK